MRKTNIGKKTEVNNLHLFIGLGNPGKDYERSHHNVGFLVLEEIAKELKVRFSKKTCKSEVAETNVSGEKVVLARPLTFMNKSGEAVKLLLKKFKPDMKNVFVVYDDIDLSSPTVRIRNHGSAGTHNGMKSVLDSMSSEGFIRVRIGIGPFSEGELSDFVLRRIPQNSEIKKGIEKAKAACLDFIFTKDYEKTVQKYSS